MIIEAGTPAVSTPAVSDAGDNDDDYTDDQHQASLDLNALAIDDPVDLTVVQV